MVTVIDGSFVPAKVGAPVAASARLCPPPFADEALGPDAAAIPDPDPFAIARPFPDPEPEPAAGPAPAIDVSRPVVAVL